ncbi:HNH/ENDO VII family nuclease [Priestia megaterium]|uniref:HNH/ENDO VII family nuclease n=1 Tax=Priestia megaterium TaxID=1404 RepID=UPI002E1ABA0B
MTGRDMFGNKISEEQRKASLLQALGIAGAGALSTKVAGKMGQSLATKGTEKLNNMRNTLRTSAVANVTKQAYQSVKNAPASWTQSLHKTYNNILDSSMPRLGPELVPAGPALAQQTVRETLQNVKQQTMQMIEKPVKAERVSERQIQTGTKGTGKEYKNYKDVEYTGTTKVNGEVRDISGRVFQRLDIDYMRIDPKTGMTNLQLMKKGRAPIWQDGTAIELHHLIQREPGSMVELPGSMHKEYYKILHGLVENGGSFRNDPVLKKQYENFRSKYWRWRAKQIDKAEL